VLAGVGVVGDENPKRQTMVADHFAVPLYFRYRPALLSGVGPISLLLYVRLQTQQNRVSAVQFKHAMCDGWVS
jgi:hypothetical protein